MSTMIVIILPPIFLLTGSLYLWKLASVRASANKYLQTPNKSGPSINAVWFVKNDSNHLATFLASLKLPLDGTNFSLIISDSNAGINSLSPYTSAIYHLPSLSSNR